MSSNTRITWPIVALVLIVVGAFVGIFALIPDNDPTARSALLAVVVTLSNAVGVLFARQSGRHVAEKIEEVQETVNGHQTDLIARIPEPQRTPAERARLRQSRDQ